MYKLIRSNIYAWRMRIVAIASLIVLTFTLQVLYTSFVFSAQNSIVENVNTLNLPFDLMIVTPRGESVLSIDELPDLPYLINRRSEVALIDAMEQAVKLNVDSVYGSITLLGIPIESSIYQPSKMILEGCWLEATGGIILPREVAEREGLCIGDYIPVSYWEEYSHQETIQYASFKVIGIYDNYDLSFALVAFDDVLALSYDGKANCSMFTYLRRSYAQVGMDITLNVFVDWLKPAFPNALFIQTNLPEQVSKNLLNMIYQPSQSLTFLIVIFAFTGILTISVMTYLERRRELAAFRTVGISKEQLIQLLLFEYLVAAVSGFVIGGIILSLMFSSLTWIRLLDRELLISVIVLSVVRTIMVVGVAILYPTLSSLNATINQLMFARRVPLFSKRLDHLDNPNASLVYREREENLRFLKVVPFEDADSQILVFKQIGQSVKRGETIALQELYFGFVIIEWCSFCDGEVVILEESGLIGIKPNNTAERFYPYPSSLIEMEDRRLRSYTRKVNPSTKLSKDDSS